MPYGWILLALISGILIGRISVHESEALPSAENEKPRRHSSTRITDPSSPRDRQRERPAQVRSETDVSIPAGFGGKLLSDSKFLSCGFEEIGSRLDQALVLLGATAGQREAVIDLFKRTEQELHDTEKQHVGVRMSGQTEIWLNMFDMEKHGVRIMNNTRVGINGILDPHQAEALIQGIDWGSFYPISYHQEIRLNVVRRGGTLFRMEDKSNGGRSGIGLSSEQFPYDAPSFSAQEVFKSSYHPNGNLRDWSHLLEGKSIVPTDDNPSARR